MTTPVAERYLTCEEFDSLPNPDDGRKMELVDGRVVYSMTVGRDHGRLAAALCAYLFAFTFPRRLGEVYTETGFRLRDLPERRGRVRGPDVSFVRAQRLPSETETRRGSLRMAPDLAIEILSPDERESDLTTKVAHYFQAGTPIVWIVRAASRSVEILKLEGERRVLSVGERLTSEDAGFDAPGFELEISQLFAVLG